MRKSNQKSEKQLEAARLYNQVLRLNLTEVPVHYQRKLYNGKVSDEVANYLLCKVNGVKYIRKNCFGWKGGNFINNMERQGTITEADLIHTHMSGKGRYQGAKVIVMMKTDILLKLKDEMMEYLRNGDWAESSITDTNHVFEAINNTSVVVCDNVIDESRIKESEEAYARRNELISEAARDKRNEEWQKEEDRRKAEREERELERLRLEESLKPQNETLQDLVAKIEAMGWEVTLRMKSQVSCSKEPEILDFVE